MWEYNGFTNFGDVSVEHGQAWLKAGGDDYAHCVTIMCGSDIGLANNQYLIERGDVYFSPDNFNAALETVCYETYGPPEYEDVMYAYQGFDRDAWDGWKVVQIGKKLDDLTARGTTCEDPDETLHGNASIEKYLKTVLDRY